MLTTTKRVLAGVVLAVVSAAEVRPAQPEPLPPLREREATGEAWLKQRLDRVLPGLMRRHGIEMWLVICREYNEDPVFLSLVSPSVMAARRRTILVFHDRGPEQGVERLALGGGGSRGLYTVFRDPEVEDRELWGEGQWALLRRLVEERQPATIGIDVSPTHAFADGLTASERDQLEIALGPFASRLVPAGALPVEYLSVRLPEMLPVYQRMMRTVHWLIGRAFSSEVIKPGETTNADVEWWLRQAVHDLGYGEWFPASVSVQRRGEATRSVLAEGEPVVIERGDHLHTDFGLTAYGLATDTQHVGYVLREGESAPPRGLVRALEVSNRLQDIVMEQLRPGLTGNQVLERSLAAMKAEGIDGTVYTHPIGDHGHGAGPLVGLWDRQEGVPGRGDLLVLPSTWFSIELQATSEVPEWDGQRLRSAQEEDAVVHEDGRVEWVLERQTGYHLVE